MAVYSLLLAVLGLAAPGHIQERAVVPLNDGWRAQRVDAPDAQPNGEWQTVDLPHTFATSHYQSAWYEKQFDAPPLPAGWRAHIHFGGAKYNSRVWLNGQEIGGHFGGYDAFELDTTSALKPGQKNLLRVHCRDWTGAFSEGERLDIPSEFHAARSHPRNRILAPIGGRFGDFGLWDRVALRYAPLLRVARATIHTLVREGRLRVEVQVTNDTAAAAETVVTGEVLDAEGKSVLGLDAKTVRVAPRQTATVELSFAANLRSWSPDDPYLHTLSVALAATATNVALGVEPKDSVRLARTATMDTYRERFGWRQLWCERPTFYFNGVPCILRASSAWPVGYRTRDEIADYWHKIKAPNVFAFRTHTQPWPELFYEVADEVGILIIPEGPSGTTTARTGLTIWSSGGTTATTSEA